MLYNVQCIARTPFKYNIKLRILNLYATFTIVQVHLCVKVTLYQVLQLGRILFLKYYKTLST